MTDTALTVLALAVAFASAALAGFLALAEEAPVMTEPATGDLPLRRAFHVARLALLILAGVSGSQAIGWWIRAPLTALWTAISAAAFLFVLADALPRMVASLAPELARAASPSLPRGSTPSAKMASPPKPTRLPRSPPRCLTA